MFIISYAPFYKTLNKRKMCIRDRYRAALAQGDDSALEGLLREGREIKEGLTLGNHTSQNRESL